MKRWGDGTELIRTDVVISGDEGVFYKVLLSEGLGLWKTCWIQKEVWDSLEGEDDSSR